MESAAAVLHQEPSVEALYRADADRLWRAVYAFAADPEIASDAVAEAYAQVLHRGAAVRDPQAWTWRAAFRIASGALKARRDADALPSHPSDVSDRYADTDLLDTPCDGFRRASGRRSSSSIRRPAGRPGSPSARLEQPCRPREPQPWPPPTPRSMLGDDAIGASSRPFRDARLPLPPTCGPMSSSAPPH